jgi:hypothetical protein
MFYRRVALDSPVAVLTGSCSKYDGEWEFASNRCIRSYDVGSVNWCRVPCVYCEDCSEHEILECFAICGMYSLYLVEVSVESFANDCFVVTFAECIVWYAYVLT